jgi:hypothetical protein
MQSFVLRLLFILSANVWTLCVSQWMHSITLDPHNKYHLKWYFDDHKQRITFNVVVETTGWVGFGISPNGGMAGSDLVIGWVDDNGVTHFHVCLHHVYHIVYVNHISQSLTTKNLFKKS